MRDFTPAFDHIVQEYTPYVALVYGRVWRYCQGELGRCTRSQTKMAEDLGINRDTIHNALLLLVMDGWLTSTPTSGGSNSYHLTDKGLSVCPTGRVSEKPIGVSESPTGGVGLTDTEDSLKREERKQGDMVDGILHYAGKSEITAFPSPPARTKKLLDLATHRHTQVFGFFFDKSKRSRWIKWANEKTEMFGASGIVALYAEAVLYHQSKELDYSGPWSLDWAMQQVASGQSPEDELLSSDEFAKQFPINLTEDTQ